MRLALGHALTVPQIFGTFKTKTLKINSKECYEKFGCRNTEKLAQQIFKKSLGLIIDDIIDNNATFHLPLGGKKAELGMDRVEGEEFKRAVENGAFKDIDFLKSEFSGYRMLLKYQTKGIFRDKKVYLDKAHKQAIIDNTNNGKQYY